MFSDKLAHSCICSDLRYLTRRLPLSSDGTPPGIQALNMLWGSQFPQFEMEGTPN